MIHDILGYVQAHDASMAVLRLEPYAPLKHRDLLPSVTTRLEDRKGWQEQAAPVAPQPLQPQPAWGTPSPPLCRIAKSEQAGPGDMVLVPNVDGNIGAWVVVEVLDHDYVLHSLPVAICKLQSYVLTHYDVFRQAAQSKVELVQRVLDNEAKKARMAELYEGYTETGKHAIAESIGAPPPVSPTTTTLEYVLGQVESTQLSPALTDPAPAPAPKAATRARSKPATPPATPTPAAPAAPPVAPWATQGSNFDKSKDGK